MLNYFYFHNVNRAQNYQHKFTQPLSKQNDLKPVEKEQDFREFSK